MADEIDEVTIDGRRDAGATREDARPAPSLAPTSLARTMHTVPERPRPRAAGAIVMGLVVSAACAATVLGLGHRAPSPYPPVTTSAAMANVGRYTVSAARPLAAEDTAPAATPPPDAGH